MLSIGIEKSGGKSMGRPRSFCTTQALNSAMQVFSRKGYEGASIAELKKAIGINSPSLYAAFGSKKELFHRVLAHYDAQNKAFMDEILAESRAQDVASLLLRGVATLVTDTSGNNPRGGLLVQSGLSCSDPSIPAELARRRDHWEGELCKRFVRAQVERDLSSGASPSALASYLMAVSIGMCVLAAEGASQEDLLGIADMAATPVRRASVD
jgi:AcrR family transcriptional regulator